MCRQEGDDVERPTPNRIVQGARAFRVASIGIRALLNE